MTQKLLTGLKILISFLFLVIITSCEKDDNREINEQVNIHTPITKNVTYSQFTSNFQETLEELKVSTALDFTIPKSLENKNYIIKTDEIKEIKAGNYTSYTLILSKEKLKQSKLL